MKTIINSDLICDNCPDKKRCKEQQEKKNNIIKNILNDIVDKAKICGCDIKEEAEILFQQFPDVTRCDVVLEKQLKRKEQECRKYKKCIKEIRDELETASHCEAEECGCDDDSECLKCTINLILGKISEVENEYKQKNK